MNDMQQYIEHINTRWAYDVKTFRYVILTPWLYSLVFSWAWFTCLFFLFYISLLFRFSKAQRVAAAQYVLDFVIEKGLLDIQVTHCNLLLLTAIAHLIKVSYLCVPVDRPRRSICPAPGSPHRRSLRTIIWRVGADYQTHHRPQCSVEGTVAGWFKAMWYILCGPDTSNCPNFVHNSRRFLFFARNCYFVLRCSLCQLFTLRSIK